MNNKTSIYILRDKSFIITAIYNIILISGGVFLLWLSALIKIPLAFSPVPITGQTLVVLLLGVLYGSTRGALTTAVYLVVGLLGLPVFQGGNSGVLYFLGATGGYLIGFIAAAYVTGYLIENGFYKKFWLTFLAMCLGNIVIYVFGLTWLSFYVGTDKCFWFGMFPFIPGDLIKIMIATMFIPTGGKILNYMKNLPKKNRVGD